MKKGSNYLKMGYGLIEIKHESTTINIGHLVDSAKLEMSTFNKTYSGLIGWCFKMPNVPYSDRWSTFSDPPTGRAGN